MMISGFITPKNKIVVMTKTILLTMMGFVLFGHTACAQRQKLFALDEAEDKLWIKVIGEEGQPKLSLLRDSVTEAHKEFPEWKIVQLNDADLQVVYEIKGLQQGFEWQFLPALREGFYKQMTPLPGQQEDSFEKAKLREPIAYTLIWKDALEHVLEFGVPYELVVQKTLLGPVDLEAVRPEFKSRQHWPYWTSAAAGLSLVGLAQIYKQDKSTANDTYLQFWEDGRPLEDATPFLTEAQDRDKQVRNLSYIGWGITGVSAGIFTYHWLKVRGKQRIYDKYVPQRKTDLSFSPLILSAPDEQAFGFNFTLSF